MNGNEVSCISDFYDIENLAAIEDTRFYNEPTFYKVEVGGNQSVYVSTGNIRQSQFAEIVNQSSGDISIVSGMPGGPDGTLLSEYNGVSGKQLISRHYLVQKKLTSQGVRLSGNPAIALDNVHHTRVGGAHWWETQIRKSQGLGRNQFHPNLKRELDITQGGLRKAGYPASQARKLRKEAEKFYERQTKLKCLG